MNQSPEKSNLGSQLSFHQETITHYMYLGLLPFFAGALGPWIFINDELWFTQTFLLYSTIIYAFLAGSLWATAFLSHQGSQAMFSNRNTHAAIGFSLVPFFGQFLPHSYHTAIMLVAFLSLLFWEKLFLGGIYPSWYQQLRHRITFIAVACHMLVIGNILLEVPINT